MNTPISPPLMPIRHPDCESSLVSFLGRVSPLLTLQSSLHPFPSRGNLGCPLFHDFQVFPVEVFQNLKHGSKKLIVLHEPLVWLSPGLMKFCEQVPPPSSIPRLVRVLLLEDYGAWTTRGPSPPPLRLLFCDFGHSLFNKFSISDRLPPPPLRRFSFVRSRWVSFLAPFIPIPLLGFRILPSSKGFVTPFWFPF